MKKTIYLFLVIFLIISLSISCDLFNPVTNNGGGGGDDDDDDDDDVITKIVFDRATAWEPDEEDLYTNIFTMNIDGTGVQQITSGNNDYVRPHFSPDGAKIVFTDWTGEDSEIMIMDSNGINITQLTNNTISDSNADFSNDGTKIVFDRATAWEPDEEDLYTNIFTMNIDGTNVQQITSGNNDYVRPHFSPDGAKIVFTDWTGEDGEIMIMDSNGTNITQLTNNTISDSNADF